MRVCVGNEAPAATELWNPTRWRKPRQQEQKSDESTSYLKALHTSYLVVAKEFGGRGLRLEYESSDVAG